VTQKEVLDQIEKMEGELKSRLTKEITRLLLSGAIDLETDAAYGIPTIVLYVALQNVTAQYRPLTNHARAIARNLSHF
jgi:hypothetical protein